MSRHVRILTPVILAMVVLSGCFSCEDQTLTSPSLEPNNVLFVPGDPVTLNLGESMTVVTRIFTLGTRSDPGTTQYSSSNPSVATVDATSGKVTCVGAGNVTITATNTNQAGIGKATLAVACTSTVVVDVTPTDLPFTHTVGTTTCPQKVGTLRITTGLNQQVTVTIVPVGPFVTVSAQSVVLAPLGATDVDVFFNCSTTTSFSTTIVVAGTSASGATGAKTITMTATVNR